MQVCFFVGILVDVIFGIFSVIVVFQLVGILVMYWGMVVVFYVVNGYGDVGVVMCVVMFDLIVMMIVLMGVVVIECLVVIVFDVGVLVDCFVVFVESGYMDWQCIMYIIFGDVVVDVWRIGLCNFVVIVVGEVVSVRLLFFVVEMVGVDLV